jgi:hypothetical protein
MFLLSSRVNPDSFGEISCQGNRVAEAGAHGAGLRAPRPEWLPPRLSPRGPRSRVGSVSMGPGTKTTRQNLELVSKIVL